MRDRQHASQRHGNRDRRPWRALVVDDEYGARLQVELALQLSDRVEIVGQASNGMRGAELAEQLRPDVIVLDLAMPVMDGFEALPLMRQLSPNAVIVVRSNHDDAADISRAMELGARAFIPKFLPLDELGAMIERAVESTEDERAQLREAIATAMNRHRGRGRRIAMHEPQPASQGLS